MQGDIKQTTEQAAEQEGQRTAGQVAGQETGQMARQETGQAVARTSNAASRKRLVIALCINLAIVVMEVIATILSSRSNGMSLFQFYTEDSNMFAGLSCLIFSVYAIRALRHGTVGDGSVVPGAGSSSAATAASSASVATGASSSLATAAGQVPYWVHVLKLVATSCLTLTFFVVIFVLAPMMSMFGGVDGYEAMLIHGSMLFQHLICPILAIVSFVFLENEPRLARRSASVALIPTVLYAVIIVILNIARVVEGPYPFLRVYQQPVWQSILWVIGIVGSAYLMALLLWKLSDKVAAKRR